MPTIAASPQNEFLAQVASALRTAPQTVSKANPVLGSLLRYLIGEAPAEVERWSYGDLPVESKANKPWIKDERLLPALDALGVAPVASAGKAVGAAGPVAKAALYAASPRKDLILTHSTDNAALGALLKGGGRELASPSFAITVDHVPQKFGDWAFVPREGRFDPKVANTRLFSHDAWTPTHSGTYEHGARTDIARSHATDRIIQSGLPPAMAQLMAQRLKTTPPGYSFDEKQLIAAARLKDRFEVPLYKQAKTRPREFTSFQQYEQHPEGAARLDLAALDDLNPGHANRMRDALSLARSTGLLDALRVPATKNPVEAMLDVSRQLATLPREAAKGVYRKYFTPAQQVEFGQAIEALRRGPTDYAELKNYGPLQLTPNNFGGVVHLGDPDSAQARLLAERLRKLGLPVEHADDPYMAFDIADELSKR